MATHKTATQRATESLYDFTIQAWPQVESQPFVGNFHIGAICEHLEAVTHGEIMKLLINIPPGCTKSLLLVMWFCWEWANQPQTRFMFNSYDQRLSTRDSVKCRSLIKSRWFQERWGGSWQLTDDQNQKTYYENSKGGYRLATTPGGHGTGEHPDRIVIDDPNNVKQAESEAERQAINEWWDLTMSTRGVSRDARRVGVMQRLHENDWSGHVLAEGDWVHLCLPMRFEADRRCTTSIGFSDPRQEEGELLTPLFNEKKVAEMEAPLGPYGTAGQMQQRPAPREGGMFKSAWFEIVESAPREFDAMIRGWDLAATEGDGDFTASVLIGRKGDSFWVLDVVAGQWGSGRRDDNMELVFIDDDTNYGGKVVTWFPQDPAQAGKSQAEQIAKKFRGYRVYYETMKGDKVTRADQLASRCWAGERSGDKVKLVKAQWNHAFIGELCVFDKGKHDDRVDAAALAFNKLAKPRRTVLVGTGEKLEQQQSQQQRVQQQQQPVASQVAAARKRLLVGTGNGSSSQSLAEHERPCWMNDRIITLDDVS